ncbi:VIT and vWA domain-containing protein [Thiohalomonas denitrificans]|uniref:Ca-activated chloride channel family protein n=1 Tax=Thiohalomonas denitrificans TaxID=415747 RepID=A0A1G5QTG8_9GAMM|nr:VIT and VWA domain-containing protein [Thiohalomonas denitrificans]SCZ64868.1 Ca-activated chloride channel family protein [Thiohalomonas denitrificans]
MKTGNSILAQGLFALLMMLAAGLAQAAGLLTAVDGSLPSLEVRDHRVTVTIEEGYAITEVEQIFANPHDRDLEAIYSFPVPDRASVAEFTMWIDGQPVVGEVLEKEQARRAYEEEKAAGREAGLTEKDAYRTFEVSVSPVRAKQQTRIRLVYFQPAMVDTGVGRYVYPLEEGGVDEEKLAFWTANSNVSHHFSFDLKLRSGYPVDAVRLPNHPGAQVTRNGSGEWTVHLERGAGQIAAEKEGNAKAFDPDTGNGAVFSLDQDLVVYWRHQPGLPGSVDLVAFKPEADKRGTFMLTVTPGGDLGPISQGTDWTFVLDVSGSMQGKFATLADGVSQAIGKMRPTDRFRLILFNDRARELTPGFVNATPEAVRLWVDEMDKVQPGSGTNLYAGIAEALADMDADRTHAIVLVTDGVANVGHTAQRDFIDLLTKKDVRLFTFIMGNSANRPLLEALTKHSGGFAINVSNSDDIVGHVLNAVSKVTHKALHGVEVSIKGVKTADLAPTEIGSLYRGQQLVLFGHYFGDGEAEVTLKGRISGRETVYSTRFDFPAVARANPEIERLWAYAAIDEMQQRMADFGAQADLEQAIVDLGIEFGLVTDYTSMVVMRNEQFEQRGIEHKNRDRRHLERAAAEQRGQAPVPSRRVDQEQPMFSGSRPGLGGGGGSFDLWMLLLTPVLLAARLRRR